MLDVVVVGGGPGGSATAKRCAQNGLRTLLLEKRKLPRDKVCSGMVMSPLAQTLIKEEFGAIPLHVLTTPPYLSGLMMHVPGVGTQKIEHRMPLAWRRDLDYWMNQKVRESGGEIWDGARVTGVTEEKDKYIVKVEKEGQGHEIEARFVVGADGAASVVRRSLFPTIRVMYNQDYRECYQGALGLDKEFIHYFFFAQLAPSLFAVHQKGDMFLVEMSARTGHMGKLVKEARKALARDYGFDLENRPLLRNGCIQPVMYDELFSGSFPVAKGNALLVGDAAALQLPVSREGICTALKSGMSAAVSIIQATKTKERAEKFYLREVEGIILTLKRLYPLHKRLREELGKGGQFSLEMLKSSFEEALKVA